MTVASTLSKKQYQGNNLTTEFPLPFQVTAKEHIFALLKKGTKIEEITTNFAVDLERKMFVYPVQGEAIKTGESLTIYRKIPLTQIVDLENAGAFHPEVLEYDGFDRIVMQIQQIDEEISRALKIDITDTRDTSSLLEELFAAREEAILYAQKALEQAKTAAEKAEMTKDWAQFAEEKVKELTELSVECSISNDGQGQVTYDKEAHRLEIVLPFDNSGSQQPKVVLTDSTNLARSDIGASAKAVHSLRAEMTDVHAELFASKIGKSAISSAIDSESEETVASSKAVNDLRKAVPHLAMPSIQYIDISLADANNFIAPANGYIHFDAQLTQQSPYAINYNMYIKNGEEQVYGVRHQAYGTTSNEGVIVPVRAGYQVLFFHQLITKLNAFRFIYAEGEL